MTNQNDIDSKLNAIATNPTQDWVKRAKRYEVELEWIDRSAKVAGLVLDRLDELGMTQKALADAMGVKPQYVSKIVKGRENLCFGTIAKIEKALDITLIEVTNPKSDVQVSYASHFLSSFIHYRCIADSYFTKPKSFVTVYNIHGSKSLVSMPFNDDITMMIGKIKEETYLT